MFSSYLLIHLTAIFVFAGLLAANYDLVMVQRKSDAVENCYQ